MEIKKYIQKYYVSFKDKGFMFVDSVAISNIDELIINIVNKTIEIVNYDNDDGFIITVDYLYSRNIGICPQSSNDLSIDGNYTMIVKDGQLLEERLMEE